MFIPPPTKSVAEIHISDETDLNPSAITILDMNCHTQNCEMIDILESPKADSVEQRDVENYFTGSNDNIIDVLTASVHPEKLNFNEKLRTVHQVFELPDSHPLLKEFEERAADDLYPYLLVIWPTGIISKSIQQHNSDGDSMTPGMCNRTNEGETVKGTILIPCRTTMRGTFPVNGSYFQVNEVFADHESSEHPIDVLNEQICNLRKRSLHCGMTATTIFRGARAEEIHNCFFKECICLRGFHRRQRVARQLNAKFHISPYAAGYEGRARL